jgi:ribosomal protein L40E
MEPLMSDLTSMLAFIEAMPKFAMLIIIAVVAFVLIVGSASRRQSRSLERRFEVRICPKCGANEPIHAMFCGSCGTRI